MAEVVALEAQVKGISNIKELRTALKDAKNELLQFEVGSEGFTRAQAKVSALSEKMKDLGDSVKIQGSGVERLQQSFGLLTEGLTSGSLDKAKLAFTGIGQAMSAIPIFLLMQGVTLLVENFDKLGKVISDFIGYVDESDAAIKRQTESINEQQNAINNLTTKYERHIGILEASGAAYEDVAIERVKAYEAELKELDVLAQKYNELYQLQEEGSEDQKKTEVEYTKVRQKQAEIRYNIDLEFAKADKYIRDNQRKEQEERDRKAKEQAKKRDEKLKDDFEQFKKNDQPILEHTEGVEYKKYELRVQYTDAAVKKIDDFKNRYYKNKDEELKKDKEIEAAKLKTRQIGLDAAQKLSEALFQFQLNRAKGNQAEELKIRKHMFEVDKAFSVARAIQDGIMSVQGALAQTAILGPAAIGLAVANGALAAANVAKIMATKFDPGSAASSTDLGTSAQTTSVPSIPTTQTRTQGSTLLDDFGRPITQAEHDKMVIKSYVVAKEITDKQKNEKRVSEITRF